MLLEKRIQHPVRIIKTTISGVQFIKDGVSVGAACKKRFLHSKQKELKECLNEKCIRQSALSVAKNVQFHSSLTEADLFTAENAIRNEDRHEEIDIKLTS
jgi:hypothetical protein